MPALPTVPDSCPGVCADRGTTRRGRDGGQGRTRVRARALMLVAVVIAFVTGACAAPPRPEASLDAGRKDGFTATVDAVTAAHNDLVRTVSAATPDPAATAGALGAVERSVATLQAAAPGMPGTAVPPARQVAEAAAALLAADHALAAAFAAPDPAARDAALARQRDARAAWNAAVAGWNAVPVTVPPSTARR